jgi:oligosaccharide repeat unit polymerase
MNLAKQTIKIQGNTGATPKDAGSRSRTHFATGAAAGPLVFFSIPSIFAICILFFATGLYSARSLVIFLSFNIVGIAIGSVVLGKARNDRFDLFEPSTIVNLMFLMYYCVRPIYLISSMSHATPDIFAARNPAGDLDFAWAVGYANVGLACFHMGYHAMKVRFRGAPGLQDNLIHWDERRATRVVFLGGVCAFLSVAISVYAAGGIGGVLANVGRLREVTAGYAYGLLGAAYFPIGVILLLIDHLIGHPRFLSIALFFVMSVGYSAIFGNRTGMFAIVLSCMVVYSYMHGIRKPWRFALVSLSIATVVIPAVVFWGFARQFQVTASEIPRVIGIMRDEDPNLFYSQILGEFDAVDSFAAVLHGGPSVFPFRFGQTYLDVASFVIPRSIWPNKPTAFSTAVGDYVTEDGNDVPPGVIGELYVNFSVFGIVVGMSLIGILMGLVYCRAMRGSIGGLALYAFLIPYFGVFLSRNFLGGGILFLTAVLPMWPAVLYIESPKRPRIGNFMKWNSSSGMICR